VYGARHAGAMTEPQPALLSHATSLEDRWGRRLVYQAKRGSAHPIGLRP
jgi:hypothetical protein